MEKTPYSKKGTGRGAKVKAVVEPASRMLDTYFSPERMK
jgi:hypothetical protein